MPLIARVACLEPDWELLKQKNAPLSRKHIEEIASFSEKYLQPEAVEFAEYDIISNLRCLWELSRQQGTKMSKAHAKRIARIAMAAASLINEKAGQPSYKAVPRTGQKHHPNSLKPENTAPGCAIATNAFSRAYYFQKAKYYVSKGRREKNHIKRAESFLKAAGYYKRAKDPSNECESYHDAAREYQLAGNEAATEKEKCAQYEMAEKYYAFAGELALHSGNDVKAWNMFDYAVSNARRARENRGSQSESRSNEPYYYSKCAEIIVGTDAAWADYLYWLAANSTQSSEEKGKLIERIIASCEKRQDYGFLGGIYYDLGVGEAAGSSGYDAPVGILSMTRTTLRVSVA